jgi:REP element-mobilizing transposase RayT
VKQLAKKPAPRRNRRSIRLPGWDYRSAAFYFITICTNQRLTLFSDPRLYEIAANTWAYIPQQDHARHVVLDEWVVMPNHVHGILQLAEDPATPLAKTDHPNGPTPGSVGAIVGNYKMLVTKRVKAMLRETHTNYTAWQRGYWERIIRNERELNATRRYIQDNPRRWAEDRDNLDTLLTRMRYRDGE